MVVPATISFFIPTTLPDTYSKTYSTILRQNSITMKKLVILSLTLLFAFSGTSFAQDEETTFTFYRIKQGMMSGATSLVAKIYLNGNEVAMIQNGTIVKYDMESEGSVKVKVVASFGNSPIGSPWVKTMDVKKGEPVHIQLTLNSLSGARGEILNEKGVKRMSKMSFDDTETFKTMRIMIFIG